MKRNLLIIAAAALVLVGCANDDLRNDIQDEQVGIGFSTFTGKLTRSENSNVTAKYALEGYHTNFKVWSSKYIAKGTNPETYDEKTVFNAQEVNHQDADNTVDPAITEGWVYSPISFWDKSATKYDFYAAAPASEAWSWDNTNKKLSLDNFSVTGTTIDASSSVSATAVFGAKDLMISEDITDHADYTGAKVNLHFIHILSRLNIGVAKATPLLDDYIVKLKSIKVFNMNSNGKFNEGQATANSNPGNNSRWIAPTEGQKTFTTGVGYTTETVVESTMNYVYQALAIPQTVAYEAGIKLDGTNATTTSKPYLNIVYEIWTKDVKYASTDPEVVAGTQTTDDVKVASYKIDDYNYTYNLADMFNGSNAVTSVNFNEGWMNTLKITINPAAIEFDADVYEWAPVTPVDVNVPQAN